MSLQDKDEDAGGCILAHDMGLGKSLQVVAVLHTYHTYYPDKRSVLVVPPNVVHNWLDEFNAWLPDQASANMSELSRDKVQPTPHSNLVSVCGGADAAARLNLLSVCGGTASLHEDLHWCLNCRHTQNHLNTSTCLPLSTTV